MWMKCCVSTDVGTWTNWLTFEPDSDCFLRYRISAAMWNFTSGKSHWRHAARASRGFKMVLFTEPSEDLLSEVHALYWVPFYSCYLWDGHLLHTFKLHLAKCQFCHFYKYEHSIHGQKTISRSFCTGADPGQKVVILFLSSLAGTLKLSYGCVRGTVGRTSLSCARPAADGWPLMWVNRPLEHMYPHGHCLKKYTL